MEVKLSGKSVVELVSGLEDILDVLVLRIDQLVVFDSEDDVFSGMFILFINIEMCCFFQVYSQLGCSMKSGRSLVRENERIFSFFRCVFFLIFSLLFYFLFFAVYFN